MSTERDVLTRLLRHRRKLLFFDIETDGLLDELTRIHCLVIRDHSTGEVWSCSDDWPAGWVPDDGYTGAVRCTVAEGLEILADAEVICGHNVIGFDIPALKKLHPKWSPGGIVRDTIVMACVVWPKDMLTDRDHSLRAAGNALPGNLIGSYSLEAFGWRLGDYKGDYGKDMPAAAKWARWSEDMQLYCEQDVAVTARLWDRLMREEWSEDSYELEHEVAWIITRQERHGFLFDHRKAAALLIEMMEVKDEVEGSLAETFPPLVVKTPFLPKVNNKARGYVKGVWTEKVRIEDFNPGSRDHIAKRLKLLGWEPDEFTSGGKNSAPKPKVDETVLSQLPYPEAAPLSRYLLIEKRIAQLANGTEAWMKRVQKDGRIHGRVNSNGALTGRMTHSTPNMAQVPAGRKGKDGKPLLGLLAGFGHECRDLFCVPVGKRLVGCDADALELRCLAHYMARYDGGDYVRIVLEGRKEDGTDIHSVNCRALGMDPKQTYRVDGKTLSGRDIAKVWFYAFIYGAGDEKLGSILGKSGPKSPDARGRMVDKTAMAAGRKSRARFLEGLPALGKLVDAVKLTAKAKGFLTGLDGRRLYVRSMNAALNTLLQSAGAVLMKKALVLLDNHLRINRLLEPGQHYEFVANVHDEWQIEADEEWAEVVGKTAADSIHDAGTAYAFRCPLAGQYGVGSTWADTH